METLAIISIISSIGTLLVVFSKTIKKSTCCSCLNCETRSPPPRVQYIPPNPLPTPEPIPRILNHEVIRDCQV
jgi:hypothetical protein